MQIGAASEPAAQALLAIEDPVRREQYLDFLKAPHVPPDAAVPRRAARSTARRAPRCSSASRSSTQAQARGEPGADGAQAFEGPTGSTLTTDHPLVIDALQRAATRWPAAVWVRDLLGPRGAGGDRTALCDALLRSYAANLVALHVHPPRLTTTPGDAPRTSRARAPPGARAATTVTNLRHASVRIEDDLGRRLVTLLDGTRDRAALAAELRAFLAERGDPVPADLAESLERSLQGLARLALLEEPEAGVAGGRARAGICSVRFKTGLPNRSHGSVQMASPNNYDLSARLAVSRRPLRASRGRWRRTAGGLHRSRRRHLAWHLAGGAHHSTATRSTLVAAAGQTNCWTKVVPSATRSLASTWRFRAMPTRPTGSTARGSSRDRGQAACADDADRCAPVDRRPCADLVWDVAPHPQATPHVSGPAHLASTTSSRSSGMRPPRGPTSSLDRRLGRCYRRPSPLWRGRVPETLAIARALRADPSVPGREWASRSSDSQPRCWYGSAIHRRSSTSASAARIPEGSSTRGSRGLRARWASCWHVPCWTTSTSSSFLPWLVPRGWLRCPPSHRGDLPRRSSRRGVAWPRRGVEGSGWDVAKLTPLGESVPARSPSSTQAGRSPATDGTRAARRGRADRVAAARLTCAPASRAKEPGPENECGPAGAGPHRSAQGGVRALLDEQFEGRCVPRCPVLSNHGTRAGWAGP